LMHVAMKIVLIEVLKRNEVKAAISYSANRGLIRLIGKKENVIISSY